MGDDICIASDDSLTDWSIPLIGAFDSTAEITAIYAKAHLRALERHFKLEHYCLYQNKQPVSSITLSIKGNIARIDDVGTLPEFQGRGYATKLLKYVLLRAKESGVTDCFLGASDAGLSIYKKLGFKVIFESENYSYQAS